MKKRQLGRTDLYVNEIGYGSMSLANDMATRPSEQQAVALLERMIDDAGVEFIDTADTYGGGDEEIGYAERLIARALAGERRRRVVVATKGGFERPNGAWRKNGRPEHLRAACEASLRALETDTIDLYQFHAPDPDVPFAESVGALAELRSQGKIRHIGLSNVGTDLLREAMEITTITSVQNPLSPFRYGESQAALLKLCEESGITFIAYAPLGGHRNAAMIPDFEPWIREHVTSPAPLRPMLLAWGLAISPSVIPIPATTRWEHLVDNMAAAELALSEEDRRKLPEAKSWMQIHEGLMADADYTGAIRQLRTGLERHPEDPMIWYNLACASALGGESPASIEALERAIALGFDDRSHIEQDTDLDSIRALPEYEELIRRMIEQANRP